MNKRVFIFPALLICITVMFSCKKDSSTPVDTSNNGTFKVFMVGNITTVQNLLGDTIIGIIPNGPPFGSDKYTYFNLEQKQIIANSDSLTTKWDLGFKGTTIIVNGGINRVGNGGAFIYNGVFENLSVVPADSVFRTDAGSNYAVPTGSGIGWYIYNGGSVNLVTPLPGRVLVIKTANGKYAKVEILNYYKGGVTPSSTASNDVKSREQRYYTFRYIYQPDGSKNL